VVRRWMLGRKSLWNAEERPLVNCPMEKLLLGCLRRESNPCCDEGD
jgi:hypothetical protein